MRIGDWGLGIGDWGLRIQGRGARDEDRGDERREAARSMFIPFTDHRSPLTLLPFTHSPIHSFTHPLIHAFPLH